MLDRHLVKFKTVALAAAFLCAAAISPLKVTAAPIDVSYTVTGSPGDWTLDFSVTNNYLASVFQFHTLVNWGGEVQSPANWTPSGILFNFQQYGASSTVYNLSWFNSYYNPILISPGYNPPFLIGPGENNSDFQPLHVLDQQAPTSVQWLAWAYSPTPHFPSLPCPETCVYTEPQQIVFESVAHSVQPVPIPAAAVLFGTGLAGLVGWQRKRLRKNA